MGWVVLGAWILAALVAAVVLGYCAFELVGKARRLRRDVGRLQELNGQLAVIQQGLAEAQARVAAVAQHGSG